MTEEIIIDGKDVSEWELKGVLIPITECKYFEGIGGCKEAGGLCVTNDNCYYKQLKRLEQENKELKELLSNEPKAIQAFQISYSGLKRDNETLWGMVKDYKSALEEIRGLASPHCTQCSQIINIINEVLGDEKVSD